MAALGLESPELEKLDNCLLARFTRAKGPDPELLEIVHRQVDFLAQSLCNVVNIFNPELIILSGFLGTLYATDPDRMEAAVKSVSMLGPREDVHIKRAELGLDILLVGAAQLAFASVLADPASIVDAVGNEKITS